MNDVVFPANIEIKVNNAYYATSMEIHPAVALICAVGAPRCSSGSHGGPLPGVVSDWANRFGERRPLRRLAGLCFKLRRVIHGDKHEQVGDVGLAGGRDRDNPLEPVGFYWEFREFS